MDYELFKQYIVEHIEELLPELDEPRIGICSILKNNGIRLDSLQILERGKIFAPNIYLNQLFEDYVAGKPIGIILETIANMYMRAMMDLDFKIDGIDNYEYMKDRIIVRIINYESNEELLENAPFLHFEDLAITFRWLAKEDEMGVSSALVTNRETKIWGIDIEELYKIGIENTKRYFPYSFDSLDELMDVLMKYEENDDGMRSGLYVLSNNKGINGATSILYEGVLDFLSDNFEDDFYILPSSVHEVILLPSSRCDHPEMLKEIVREANEMTVPPGDILSYSVYRYDRKQSKLSIVSNN